MGGFYFLIYFITLFNDHISRPDIHNTNTNVVVIPNPSNKNFAIINPIAPTMVATIARVESTVPRSFDLML